MSITIFYDRNFIPYTMYIFILIKVLKKRNYKCSVITDLAKFSKNTDYLVLFMTDIDKICNLDTGNVKIIFIHLDYIINHAYVPKIDDYIIRKNPQNVYIWDYSYLNFEYYSTHYPRKMWTFIPLSYHEHLTQIYANIERIPYHQKQYDVLFLGMVSPRRRRILEEINQKHKLAYMYGNDNIKEYLSLVENSRIVLHVPHKEINTQFDYCRLGVMYANKIMVVSEKIRHFDYSIETQLPALMDKMICADYDKICETVSYYLSRPYTEIEKITNDIYDEYIKYKMEDNIYSFFDTFTIENSSI
jgi:hypothetical protein